MNCNVWIKASRVSIFIDAQAIKEVWGRTPLLLINPTYNIIILMIITGLTGNQWRVLIPCLSQKTIQRTQIMLFSPTSVFPRKCNTIQTWIFHSLFFTVPWEQWRIQKVRNGAELYSNMGSGASFIWPVPSAWEPLYDVLGFVGVETGGG